MIPTQTGISNLIDLYGAVTLADIAAFDMAYMGSNTRNAQDNRALYNCIMNSLTSAGKSKVALRQNDYTGHRENRAPYY